MLINSNGREMRAETLPKGGKPRDAALATLREVLVPASIQKGMFTLGERALLREKAK